MSVTTEINFEKELKIIAHLKEVDHHIEMIYKELDQDNNSEMHKGKIILISEIIKIIKRDYGI